MSRRIFSHIMSILLTFLMSGIFMCCYDYDGIIMTYEEARLEDFALAFDISLNTIPGSTTRATHKETNGEEIDNEVDVEGMNHDFRILFFDKDDNFLLDIGRTYYKLEDVSEGRSKHWRVTIPSTVLRHRGTLEKIQTENFKIAVLANWPKDKKVNFEYGDKLYKLSQYTKDDEYNKEPYSHLPALGNLMGAYTDWVKSGYTGQNAAEEAIRTEKRMNPRTITRKTGNAHRQEDPYIYNHVWRVWTFGDGQISYMDGTKINETFADVWQKQFDSYKSALSTVASDGFSGYGGTFDEGGLVLEGVNGSTTHDDDDGLTLAMGLESSDNSNIVNNRLKFKAFATGTLKVTARKATEDGADVWLGMQRKENSNSNASYRETEKLGNAYQTYTFSNIPVTGTSSKDYLNNPEIISIYAVGGSMVVKHIEFIEGRHLYETDREGFLPDKDRQLIPMYGIQEFDAIDYRMIPDEVFYLSPISDKEFNDDYTRKNVHLLRSLAKVELLIPAGLPLTHAYMRSANRTSRCEPVDVSAPTNELWDSVDDEIGNIKSYGAFYDSADSYQEKLSWFYGTWDKWWGWNDKNFSIPQTSYDYPHIFNTRISRSDYIHFRYMETQDGYDRYVLYVPEKNIDDPNDVGVLRATPKVPHIELRFEGSDDANLDDNDCWRIYFTDDEDWRKVAQNGYDDYEKVRDNLNKLYPIVRNHIYRFTVNLLDRSAVCTVREWDKQETEIKFF